MRDWTVTFKATVDVHDVDAAPPVLSTVHRPRLLVDGSGCLFVVTAVSPPDGIPRGSSGTVEAVSLCAEGEEDRFEVGLMFQLAAGSRVFAEGRFVEIVAKFENPAHRA